MRAVEPHICNRCGYLATRYPMRKVVLLVTSGLVFAAASSAQAAGVCSIPPNYKACTACCDSNQSVTNRAFCKKQCEDFLSKRVENPDPASTRSEAGKALAGKTRHYTNSKGQSFWVTYHANGTVSAKTSTGASSGGVWFIRGSDVCSDFSAGGWSRTCRPL